MNNRMYTIIQATEEIRHQTGTDITMLAGGVMAMLQAGRCLFLLKEHQTHENFTKCLSQAGIGLDIANRMILSARKFLDKDGRPNRETFIHLNSMSKIYELARLDDEDIEALQEGGSLAGKTLDDIDKMTVRELKEHMRGINEERRAEREAQAEILAKESERAAPEVVKPTYNTLELCDAIFRRTGRSVNITWMGHYFTPSAGLRWTADDLMRICAVLRRGL